MERYVTVVKKVDEITESERDAMVALYLSYYDASDAHQVREDLASKSEVLLLNYNGALVGFTTLLVYQRLWQGKPIIVIFSGDTIVDRAHWGQQMLATAWITRMGQLAAEQADIPMYWFLIVKGHRTFKYLPTFAKSFFPHWQTEHADLKALADFLAKEKFADEYNQASGVVEFEISRGQLKPEIADPNDAELSKEAVRFFLEKNPGYLRGHELVCLCEISEQNMKPLTRRIFRRGRDG